MPAQYEPRVAPWKKEEVKELTESLREHDVIGIARIDKLPSRQFQEVRAAVRDEATIRVVRNTLLRRAIDNVEDEKPGLDEIKPFISGQTALLLSDSNPFQVFRTIEDNKASAPASAGDTAPEDIWVEEGETPFKPGPVVGDLQKAGLPAKIEGGAVVISEDELVAEEGETIDAELADALSRLEIKPMVVGLDMKAAWESGTVFDADVLDVDQEAFLDDLVAANQRAHALALGAEFPTPETVPELLQRGFARARSLGLEGEVFEPEIVEDLLARAHGEAQSLSGTVDLDAAEEPDEAADEGDEAADEEDAAEAEDEAAEAEDEADDEDDTDD
jgi:large subunit ribosomal protein L10